MEKDLEARLLAKQVKPTAMRLLALDALLKQRTAVTLPELEQALGHADRVTLYRTLKTFSSAGIVHTIDDGSGVTKYALCDACDTEQHHDLHLHFSCTTCHETRCLSAVQVPSLQLPAGFLLQEISLVARGTCSRCSAA